MERVTDRPINEIVLQHEPTELLQVSHRRNSQPRRFCSCQCHRFSKMKTPDFLRQVTGQLFVGYAHYLERIYPVLISSS